MGPRITGEPGVCAWVALLSVDTPDGWALPATVIREISGGPVCLHAKRAVGAANMAFPVVHPHRSSLVAARGTTRATWERNALRKSHSLLPPDRMRWPVVVCVLERKEPMEAATGRFQRPHIFAGGR